MGWDVSAATELPGEPASVGAARQWLSRHLTGSGVHSDTVDTVVLLASELVTNAVLHAHTDVHLRVLVGGEVRVEVSDQGEHMPTRRRHTKESVTGRGLEIVELLADDYGVDAVPTGGKTVWFTAGRGAGGHGEMGWRTEEPEAVPPPNAVEVQLLGLPFVLYDVMRQHNEALLRDYALYRLDHAGEEGPRLEDISAADAARSRISAAADAEHKRGERHLDLIVAIDDEDARAMRDLQSVFDHAEELALDGHLLTRPTLPEISGLRRWCVDQILGQLAGVAAARWRGDWLADPAPRLAPSPAVADAARAITVTEDAVVLGDIDNRIVALSAAAAELVGWAAEELIGRRITWLIPPRLREAHVAGFTRLQLTGRTHMLDHPTAVMALHRDGREIPVTLTLHRHTVDGLPTFVARLVPVHQSA